MENDWTHDQKLVKKETLRAEMEKGKRTGEFLGMVLRKCKLHDGPLTSINELEEFLKRENGDKKKLLRVEIQFQRLTNSRDFQERPDLYKVNGLNGEEMITNLATFLASDAVANHGEDVMFNSEDQIMSILRHKEQETIVESSTQKYRYQDPLIVLWHNRKGTLKWNLGFYLDENDDYTIRVDHLERNLVKDKDGRRAKSNIQWVRPKTDDIHDVDVEQILSCRTIGEWKLTEKEIIFELNPLTTIVPLMEHPKNLCLVIGKCLGSLFYGVLLHYYAILTRIDPFQKFRIGPVKVSACPSKAILGILPI